MATLFILMANLDCLLVDDVMKGEYLFELFKKISNFQFMYKRIQMHMVV